MSVLGLSSELRRQSLKKHCSAFYHLKNDLIVCELRGFFRWITAVNEFHKLWPVLCNLLSEACKIIPAAYPRWHNCQTWNGALPVALAVAWKCQELLLQATQPLPYLGVRYSLLDEKSSMPCTCFLVTRTHFRSHRAFAEPPDELQSSESLGNVGFRIPSKELEWDLS